MGAVDNATDRVTCSAFELMGAARQNDRKRCLWSEASGLPRSPIFHQDGAPVVIQLSRILCAVDFSRPARAAFARALALSREHNAELTVVQAVPVTESFGLRGRARMTHIAALRHAAEAEGVSLRVSVQHGDPAGVIVLHANARAFDLVIVGTHQRVGMGRLREGSVAERVIQRVTSPS